MCRPKIVWSAQHDVMLCREILLAQPFQHKFGLREREHAWDEVAMLTREQYKRDN